MSAGLLDMALVTVFVVGASMFVLRQWSLRRATPPCGRPPDERRDDVAVDVGPSLQKGIAAARRKRQNTGESKSS